MLRDSCKLIVRLLAGIHLLIGAALAAASNVPEVENLQQDGRHSAERGLPILVAFTASNCTFCVKLEQDFLEPMLKSGDYADRVIIRTLTIDRPQMIRDFDGGEELPRTIAARYGVALTPTVLLLGPDGEELTDRMIGLTTPDYYGAYLDQAIATARKKLPR